MVRSTRLAVMYAGQIVDLYTVPKYPYTQHLLYSSLKQLISNSLAKSR